MHFVLALGDFHPARFAAAAGMDLRLDDDDVRAEPFGLCDRLLRTECRQSPRHIDTELLQNLLGLVLMNVHLVEPPFLL